jgi:Ion channel
MFGQLLVGGAVSLVNIAVHSFAMAGVIFVFKRRQAVQDSLRFQVHLVLLMIAVVLVLNVAHLVEVAIWALLYSLLGVAPWHVSPFYFALVNFTTLGYGDVLPVARWEMLGPLTAMNGILLLGWSTAAIFAVLASQLRDR